ncbi:MAG: alpha-L-fucosidase [Acidobacteriota bacterium]
MWFRRHRWILALVAALYAANTPPAPGGASGGTRPRAADTLAWPATAARGQAPDSARLDWWREARFGLFIHWGLYAIPAGAWNGRTDHGEWIRHTAQIPIDVYDRLQARFNPATFDPDAWVRMAKQAGMKYIVITTKHHDGFALFDSKVSDFDVMATPYGRDIVRQLADACAREGIRLGLYHSIMDWHHPDYLPRRPWEADSRPGEGAEFDRYVAYMKAQVRELLTNYGPIGIMWFDGQWEGTWTNERGRDLYEFVRSLQPSIIVNNRVGRAGGDFGLDRDQGQIGDFGTPEQEIPATGVPGLDWETCMTMNRNWGYNQSDKDFKSTKDLIRRLVDIASKGGNFLLNVGPTAAGEFPPESVERLREIGEWMAAHGESIHGTQASPFPSLPWGRCTRRRLADGTTRLYLHVWDRPADGVLVVPGLLNGVLHARPLGALSRRANLDVVREGDDLRITLSPVLGTSSAPEEVVVLDIAGEPDVAIPPAIEADAAIFVDSLDVRLSSDRANIDIRYTTDGREPTAISPDARGPVRISATTTMKAPAFRAGRPVSPVAEATFTRVTPRLASGVKATASGLTYTVVEGDFSALPDFTATPARSGMTSGFDLGVRTRDTRFAVRYTGYLQAPTTGVYRLFLRSDDGSRLWLGDDLVIDNDGLHSSRERHADVALAAGQHPITVAMFERDGGFELTVSWRGPDRPRERIPHEFLRLRDPQAP